MTHGNRAYFRSTVAVTCRTRAMFHGYARDRGLERYYSSGAWHPETGTLYRHVAETRDVCGRRFDWREHWGPYLDLGPRFHEVVELLEARGVPLRVSAHEELDQAHRERYVRAQLRPVRDPLERYIDDGTAARLRERCLFFDEIDRYPGGVAAPPPMPGRKRARLSWEEWLAESAKVLAEAQRGAK